MPVATFSAGRVVAAAHAAVTPARVVPADLRRINGSAPSVPVRTFIATAQLVREEGRWAIIDVADL